MVYFRYEICGLIGTADHTFGYHGGYIVFSEWLDSKDSVKIFEGPDTLSDGLGL